jgi:MoaA/NifB/PqqE/SkfB family radical SAM enzyme
VVFHGLSMAPFLADGDDLSLEPIRFADVRPGDIVTCRLDDRFPTLRVMRKARTKLRLRGDGWPFADFEAWPDDLVGRVTERRRGGTTLTRRHAGWRAAALRALAGDTARHLKRSAVREVRRVTTGAVRRARLAIAPHRDRPASLHVNISASCNLGCRMCPYLEVHDDSGYAREMTEETFRSLLPTIATLRSIILSGSGEPLFNRQTLRFVELARQANPSIEVDITTNGTLVTPRLARAIVSAGVHRLIFSIDGATQETVGSIRIGINLAKVLDNLRSVAAAKTEAGSAWPRLAVSYMVGYGSYDELPAFVRRARALGVTEINLLEVLTGTEEAARTSLRANLGRDGGRTLREAKRLADAAGIRLSLPTTLAGKCLHPYTPHVSESGDVSPCCYVDYEGRTLWDDGRIQLPQIRYGNVTTTAFEAIWHGDAYDAFRTRNRLGDFPDFCRTCHSVRAATSAAVRDALA